MFVDGKGKLSKDLGPAIVNPNTSNANVSVTLRGSAENQRGLARPAVKQSHRELARTIARHRVAIAGHRLAEIIARRMQ